MLSKKFIKLVGRRWLWPPVYNYSPFIQGSGWNCREFFDKFYKGRLSFPLVLLIDKKESVEFIPGDKMIELSREIFGQYLEDQKILARKIALFEAREKEVEKLYRQYGYKKILATNSSRMILVAKEARKLIWELNGLIYFVAYFDKDIAWESIKGSNFDISREDFDSIWDKGTSPVAESFDKQQKKHILQLFTKGAPWSRISEECQYFFATYKDVKGLGAVEKELKEKYSRYHDKDKAKRELLKEKSDHEKTIDDFETWFKALGKEQKILVKYFQEIIRLRDSRKNIFGKGLTIMWRTAEKIFDEAGVDKRLILYYTFTEMVEGVMYLEKNAGKIAERENGFIMLINYDGTVEFEYSSYKDNKRLLLDHRDKLEKAKESSTVKGQVGCPGRVRGRAMVILDISLEKDFKDGDILVTGMTRPEFVPLMKKASAIVTDEGGITCHAAIISRELGIPCIIGTKIATKVLKDGQTVEVDADKGIVKILEK